MVFVTSKQGMRPETQESAGTVNLLECCGCSMKSCIVYTGPAKTGSGTGPPTASEFGATKSEPIPRQMPSTQTRNTAVGVQLQPSAEKQGTCHVDH